MSTLKNELESEVSSPRSQPNVESLLQKLSIKVIFTLIQALRSAATVLDEDLLQSLDKKY